jgi:hypothetical protein
MAHSPIRKILARNCRNVNTHAFGAKPERSEQSA